MCFFDHPQAMNYIVYWFYFFSGSLGIPRDLISRNHRGSLESPGNRISGDSWGSPGSTGDLLRSLGL